VIVPLLGALGLGTGGAAIPAATGLPGAGLTKFIPGAASGGFVEEGGLARIHKGETIIPAGGGDGVNVNLTGQVIRQGTTTKTVYDTTTRQQEQKHPTYRG